jgi:hypothetical protein
MEAEAAGIERRAAALSQNQEAVIAQQIAENLPAIVQAAASPFEHVGNFTVLNGAEGVTGALAQIIQQAGTLSSMAREALMPQAAGNGTVRSANGSKPVRGGTTVTPAKPTDASVKAVSASGAANGSGAGRRDRSRIEAASPASSPTEPPVEETTH